MSATAKELLNDAARTNGKLGPGRTLSVSEEADSLRVFQRMIDAWNAEQLLLYSISRDTYGLVSGKSPITIGPGPGSDWVAPRPLRLEGLGLVLTYTYPHVETPIKILTNNEWERHTTKDLQSNLPREAWYNNGWPNGEFFFYPVPLEGNDVAVYGWDHLTEPVALDTIISLPPGYEQAIVFNLAVLTCILFQRPVTDYLMQTAIESKALIKRTNYTIDLLRCDPAITGHAAVPGIGQFYSGE